MGKPRLPQGPPKKRIIVEVKFSPQELKFIDLRYQKGLAHKEVAAAMGITFRRSKVINERITWKCGLSGEDGNPATSIQILKLLIRHGFVTVEDA